MQQCTRWLKYDRDKLWLVYTQSVPVIFEPPCTCRIYHLRFLSTEATILPYCMEVLASIWTVYCLLQEGINAVTVNSPSLILPCCYTAVATFWSQSNALKYRQRTLFLTVSGPWAFPWCWSVKVVTGNYLSGHKALYLTLSEELTWDSARSSCYQQHSLLVCNELHQNTTQRRHMQPSDAASVLSRSGSSFIT